MRLWKAVKKLTLIRAALFGACVSGYDQLVLKPGETWTYEFTSLPSTGNQLWPGAPAYQHGEMFFSMPSGMFQSGDMLCFEMFENSTREAPIASAIATNQETSGGLNPTGSVYF